MNDELINLELTGEQIIVLDRIFNIIGEENLRAHYFTKADVSNVYELIAEVRHARDENQLWETES